MKRQRMAELVIGLMGAMLIVSAAYVIASGGVTIGRTRSYFKTPPAAAPVAPAAGQSSDAASMQEWQIAPEAIAAGADFNPADLASSDETTAAGTDPVAVAVKSSIVQTVAYRGRGAAQPIEEMEPLPEGQTAKPKPPIDRRYEGTPHNPRADIEKRRAAKERAAQREDGHMQPRRADDDETMTIRSSSQGRMSQPTVNASGQRAAGQGSGREWLAAGGDGSAVAAATTRRPAVPVGTKEQYGTTRQHFPPGNATTAAIILERVTPVEVRLGQGLTYELKVTNTTGCALSDVMVHESPPDGMEVRNTQPKVDKVEDGLSWAIGTLAARETKSLTVTGTARAVGDLRGCATVTFNTAICSATRVVEPALQLVKTAPGTVILCDTIPVRLRVTNTGSGFAKNVRISDSLPEGWMTIDGQRSLNFAVGDLAAGESREYAATLKSTTTGRFTNQATATEDGGLSAEASTETLVVKPELEITKTGPAVRYLNRPAKYEITVTNRGDATAVDTILTDEVPGGTQFVESTDGGQLKGGRVVWRLGDLNPGESKNVTVTLKPTEKGTYTNTVEARSYCAEAVAAATTKAEGVPAMLLEVIDVDDPIEVGAETTYEIIVTNQGTAEGTGVVINVTLPEELEYISASGPTQHTAADREIRFAPLPRLAEKGRVVYKVHVRGLDTGDVRFRCSMTSDQLQTPVEETESTHVYR